MQTRQGNTKPKAIIVEFVNNKSKMKILTNRQLKGEKIAIMEGMAQDLAKG